MAYFFDGAVIMILIVTALTGYCKGFVRYVITMLGTVAAVLVAFLIANMSAENVYNKYFKTQRLLTLAGEAQLYPKNTRDCILIDAINKGYDVAKLNKVLFENGSQCLK